jgi:hypothetical protein
MERNTLERREKIKDMILTTGLWSINKKQLARDFGVSYPTIYSDIRAIVKDIPDDKVEVIGYELNQSFKDALSIARGLLNQNDDSLKLKAVDVLTKAIDRYTVFLEAFGKKPRIVETLNILQEPKERIIFFLSNVENFVEWLNIKGKTEALKAWEEFKEEELKIQRMKQKERYVNVGEKPNVQLFNDFLEEKEKQDKTQL